MPLVRLDFRKGRAPGFGRQAGAIVYEEMVRVLKAPKDDNFQVVTEHGPEGVVYDPTYLGIQRSDGVLFLQITLNEGRSLEQKKEFYRSVVERLHAELGVRREDVLFSLVEVKKENWSFGNGAAPYA